MRSCTSCEGRSIVRRPRSFGRSGSKFVPKSNRRFLFRSRNKDDPDKIAKSDKQSLGNVDTFSNPISQVTKPSRRRFTPSTSARNKYRLNINTRPLRITEDEDVASENLDPEPLNIRPTPSISSGKYQTPEASRDPSERIDEALHLDNYPIIISSIDNDISGMIEDSYGHCPSWTLPCDIVVQ